MQSSTKVAGARPPRVQALFAAVRPAQPDRVVPGFSPSHPTLTQIATGEANYNSADYQAVGSSWLIEHPRGILADDMGLGKTKMVLDAIHHLHANNVLVVCEAANVDTWLDEVELWYPGLPVYAYRGAKRKNDEVALHAASIVLMSYAIYRNDYEYLPKQWGWIILDEGQAIRGNPLNDNMSQIATCIHNLRATRKHILTGTPLVANPGDCWNLMRWLGYEDRDWEHFARECLMVMNIDTDAYTSVKKIIGATPFGAAQLRNKLQSNMIRRSKKDHLVLPPKTNRPIYVRMSAAEAKEHLASLAFYKKCQEDIDNGLHPDRDPRAQLTTLLKQCSDAKSMIDKAEQMTKEAIGGEQKVVIYCTRTSTLRLLYTRLKKYGITYLHGSVSPTAARGKRSPRQKAIDKFNKDEKCNVMIATQQCCRTGHSFVAGSVIIRVAREWNPAWNEQAEARLDRAGQTKPVFVYDLHAVLPDGKPTAEDRVMKALANKSRNTNLVMVGAKPRALEFDFE